MQSLPFPEGWIEGRGNGKESIPSSCSSSSALSLCLMSDAAAEDIRHIFGQELRVPFILPSSSFLLLAVPPATGNVLYKGSGRGGALRDSVGLFEWVLNFIQLSRKDARNFRRSTRRIVH